MGDPADYAKCNHALAASWTKIGDKDTKSCPTSGDQAALQADITAASSCVTTELSGPSESYDTCAEILCGNGAIDAGEDCYQAALGGATCDSATSGVESFGTLACAANRTGFDTSNRIKCAGAVVDGHCWVLGNTGIPASQRALSTR